MIVIERMENGKDASQVQVAQLQKAGTLWWLNYRSALLWSRGERDSKGKAETPIQLEVVGVESVQSKGEVRIEGIGKSDTDECEAVVFEEISCRARNVFDQVHKRVANAGIGTACERTKQP